jgi:hypothetical protein
MVWASLLERASMNPLDGRMVMTRVHGKGVRTVATGLALAAVLSLTAPTFAADLRPAKAPAGNGLTAAIDPATGKLRQPTAEENRTLVAGLETMLKSSTPLQVKRFGDGTKSIVLGTSFLNISVAQAQNGKLRQVCIDNAQSAAALMNPTPVSEEK